MQIKEMNVTPEMAKGWLKTNTLNRPKRPGYIKALAQAMKRGEWKVTHQPVALNGTRLLDGQHRLEAVIASGLPSVRMLVATGAETSTFDVIDIGAKRTNSDIFREDNAIMQPVNFVGRLVFNRPTPTQLVPVYEKLKRPFRELSTLHSKGYNKFTTASIKVGVLAAILNGENKEYVHDLYRKICAFELQELPKIAQDFMRQLSLGKTNPVHQKFDLMIRAFNTVTEANKDYERLMVRDTAGRTAAIRKIYIDALGLQKQVYWLSVAEESCQTFTPSSSKAV